MGVRIRVSNGLSGEQAWSTEVPSPWEASPDCRAAQGLLEAKQVAGTKLQQVSPLGAKMGCHLPSDSP